jgi:hydrogenase-4 component B
MLVPMAVLLAACAWIGLLPGTLRPLLEGATAVWAAGAVPPPLSDGLAPLGHVALSGWLLLALLLVAGVLLRRRARPAPGSAPTWGCGYRFAAPRMQYTASSFADTLVGLLRYGLWTERHGGRLSGPFPGREEFASHTPDAVLDRVLTPAFRGAARLFRWLRAGIQHGVTPIYLLYVALTLIVLLTMFTR